MHSLVSGGSEPSDQVTVLPDSRPGSEAETNVAPAGSVNVSTASKAMPEPVFS